MRGGGFGVPGRNGGDFSPPRGTGWAAGRRPRGLGSRQGALSMRDAPPIFFLKHQKENAPRPVEKKKCSAGRSAPAQTSCRRRGKVGCPARQSETETRRPWGNLQPGAVRDTLSDSPRCRSRFFEEQPAAAKREAAQCVNHPDAVGTIRHGTAVGGIAEGPSVPEGQAKSALAPIRRPPCARRATAPERANAFLFGPCTARFSFGKTKYGALAAPRAVGRGGARERAQFSPQAETEFSGLCDDDNGGRIPAGQAPLREQTPPWPPVRRPLHACVHRPLQPSSGRSTSDPWVA